MREKGRIERRGDVRRWICGSVYSNGGYFSGCGSSYCVMLCLVFVVLAVLVLVNVVVVIVVVVVVGGGRSWLVIVGGGRSRQ